MPVDLPGPMGNSSGKGKAVIVLGDRNLDQLKFDRGGALQPLVDQMMQRTYPHRVVQCVQGPTHSWPGHRLQVDLTTTTPVFLKIAVQSK